MRNMNKKWKLVIINIYLNNFIKYVTKKNEKYNPSTQLTRFYMYIVKKNNKILQERNTILKVKNEKNLKHFGVYFCEIQYTFIWKNQAFSLHDLDGSFHRGSVILRDT